MNKPDASPGVEKIAGLLEEIATLRAKESKLNEAIDSAIKRGFGCDIESLPAPHERRFSGAVLEAAHGDTEFISKWLRLFLNARDEATEVLRVELSRERERHQDLVVLWNELIPAALREPNMKRYDIRRIALMAQKLLEPQPAPVDTGGK